MIGYYCPTCGREHRYEGECPYEYRSRTEEKISRQTSERDTSSVSIWKDIKVGESIKVYLNGKQIVLKRTS